MKRTILPLLVFGALLAYSGQGEEASEYQIKGAFILKFAGFVEWPESTFQKSNSPFEIAIVGDDPFGAGFDRALSGRTIQGHSIVVRRYRRAEDAMNAQVVFISSSEKIQHVEILKTLRARKILTVGESEQFCRASGMIGFTMSQGSVRFAINADAAKQAGVKISSELLRLATIVKTHDE